MTRSGQAPAIVVLDAAAVVCARKIVETLPGARLHGRLGRIDAADVFFDEATTHLADLFRAGTPIIAFCAAGIVIRALAPYLGDKRTEPPVIAMSHDGTSVVPLLGGHRGANRLAQQISETLGSTAAITTAGDTVFGLALDDPPEGWIAANPSAAKPIAAALLASEPVALNDPMGLADWLHAGDASWGASASETLAVHVSDKALGSDAGLVLHPPVLAVGVGCERNTDPAELLALVRQTLIDHGLAVGAVAAVVSIDVKADEAAVHAVAEALGVPARFYDAATLEAETPRLQNPSDIVFAEVGCHGVSEGAALAAVGSGGMLIVPKVKSQRATCAIARATASLDASNIGRARGSLTLVGLGPGTPLWRTPAADVAIAAATDVVGYGLYLDLIADRLNGKTRHDSNLTQEEARARRALDLAAEGRDVVLVGSGDVGIYALATLVFELLDREDRPDWRRVPVETVPGVTAMQAAAARAGAPLGHDFCAISLSDLLTPWEAIEKRLTAAADSDFVVSLYNPVSKRRREHLMKARSILLTGRGPETPVVLARNLGRDDESVTMVSLGDLTSDMVDMLTVVVIGSSNSRLVDHDGRARLYTPRGYAAKMEPLGS